MTAEQVEQRKTLIAMGYREWQIDTIDPSEYGECIALALLEEAAEHEG